MTGSLLEEIAKERSPLAAEQVLCGVFSAVQSGLPQDAQDEERAQALTVLLGLVIVRAEGLATAEALALLRVCSVLGPAATRGAAVEAADRLVSAGVPEPKGVEHVSEAPGDPTYRRRVVPRCTLLLYC